MNDFDRWVHLEGPEPAEVRELFDAVRGDPGWTPEPPERSPEEEAELERRVFAAVAADRRRRARARAARRAAKAVVGLVFCATVIAGALALSDVLHTEASLAPRVEKQRATPLWAPPGASEVRGRVLYSAAPASSGSATTPPRPVPAVPRR